VTAHRTRRPATIVETGPESARLLLTWREEPEVPAIGDQVEVLFSHPVRHALEVDHAPAQRYPLAIAPTVARDGSNPPDATRRGPGPRSRERLADVRLAMRDEHWHDWLLDNWGLRNALIRQ
jgi:hypothetical protein